MARGPLNFLLYKSLLQLLYDIHNSGIFTDHFIIEKGWILSGNDKEKTSGKKDSAADRHNDWRYHCGIWP